MASLLDLDIIIDMIFTATSLYLFYYGLKARKYLTESRGAPEFLQHGAYVGLVAMVAGIFETIGDLADIPTLRALHAIGMLMMSTILIVGIRAYLRTVQPMPVTPGREE